MTFKTTRASAVVVIAEERLYLNSAQTEVVKEGDPAAASLLCGKGQPIPARWAEKVAPQTQIEVVGTEPEHRSTRPVKPGMKR